MKLTNFYFFQTEKSKRSVETELPLKFRRQYDGGWLELATFASEAWYYQYKHVLAATWPDGCIRIRRY